MTTASAAMIGLALATSLAVPPGSPPADWRDQVDRYLAGTLKDPASALKEPYRGPRWSTFKTPAGLPATGWIVCYKINAKNSFGGYVGYRYQLFVLGSGGGVIKAVALEPGQDYLQRLFDNECARSADPTPAGV